ncbi:MAG: response regulator [Planctomycetota bacterium]|jgi:DNA-binding NtrC family response regulator
MSKPAILFIDDEESILNALKRLLRKEPYKVFTATSAEEAYGIIEKENVKVVVSDQRMPEIEGTQFLSSVKEKWPETVRVILSGYAEVSSVVDAINSGEIYRFLAKPWNDDDLKTSINQCFENYDLKHDNKMLLEKTRRQNELLGTMVNDQRDYLNISQKILNEIPYPVLSITRDEKIMVANKSAVEYFGISDSFVPGANMLELLSEEVVKNLKEYMNFSGTFRGLLPGNLEAKMEFVIKKLDINGVESFLIMALQADSEFLSDSAV